jgi:hypothetical protein
MSHSLLVGMRQLSNHGRLRFGCLDLGALGWMMVFAKIFGQGFWGSLVA